MEEKNRNIQISLILVFVVLTAVLFFLLDSRKSYNQQRHLQLTTERYQLAYNTIYNQYKQLATNIHSGMQERFDIRGVYQKLLTADEEQKKQLRNNLYATINQRYEELLKSVKLRQLHFHLQNNESFLRFHRPKKFGDNLTDVRETVNYVNTVHSPIDGFEEGRIYNGYRFVFPITAADETHLGSVEVSFGPEALTSSMMKQYLVLSNFFIKEETITRKVFIDEKNRNYRKSHHKGYLYDNNVLKALKEVSRIEVRYLKLRKEATDRVYTNAHSGQSMSHYDTTSGIIVTTIPVLNPVTHEMIAFFSIRSRSDFYRNEMQHFRLLFSLSLLLLLMVMTNFYLQYRKRCLLHLEIEGRKRTEQALIESKQRYHQIFITMADALLIFDNKGAIVNANPAACETYGYEYDELVDLTSKDIVCPNCYFLFEQFIKELKNEGEFHAESVDVRKDGTTFDIEIRGTTIDLNGEMHLLAIVRDISERKQHESERASYQEQLEGQVKVRTLELEQALAEVKSLSGILPICSFCKKIRDDDGYWLQVEQYIAEHSEAVFSHGLCQECMSEHYGKYLRKDKEGPNNNRQ